MHIPVKDKNSFFAVLFLGHLRGKGHAIEDAKPHHVFRLGMVPGWAGGAEAVCRLPRAHGFCDLQCAAGRKPRSIG
jgi:hypothetical protein